MTMANATSSTPHRPSSSASLRKTNKPLMEKRRRARINDSLGQLKSLVIQSSKKDSSQFNKLEKADILELTVKHLRTIQQPAQSAQDPNSATKYRAGFIECANEVMRFLKQSSGFSDDIKTRVLGHLGNCLQTSQQQTVSAAAYTRPAPPAQVNTISRLNPTTTSVAPSTTAQLSNGQIIQIVNAQYQTAPQVSVQQNPTAVFVSTSAASAPVAAATTTLRCPAPEATRPTQDMSRLCQPLSIQIPINRLSSQLVQPVIKMETSASSSNHSLSLSSSNTSTTSSSPSPNHKDNSPPQPRSSAYKHLDFYANDIHNDFPSRSRSLSSSTSSSTSSSVSSDCEMASPLNLSGTPPFKTSISPSFSPDKPYTHKKFNPQNFTSVIVNSRKALDIPSSKYMRMMMEDERACVRAEGTPSPASSMGESLWRPW